MSLAPGRRLGPYEVTSQIGVGGMGEVYRATDANLKRAVAIKVLPSDVSDDPERLARFQREAEVLATLNHPNIAAIYGLEKSDGVTALVMELIEGSTLADRIAQRALPVDEALAIARQIAEALQAAHEQGVIHRDLKPANIKVRGDGTVKVLDFGLAKMLEPGVSAPNLTLSPTITSPVQMTGVGVLIGTAAYMSPEQGKGRPADKRSDIWAFGCVLYEMLAGKPAFGGETLTEIVAAVLKNEPDWNAIPAATPGLARALLRRCLQKDPSRRLQHAGDARIEIEEAIAEPADPAATVSVVRRRASVGVVFPWALVALVSIALVSVMRVGRSGSSPPGVIRLDLSMPAGVEQAINVSPNVALSEDGRIAFVGGTGGLRRLYVRRLADSDATLLRGTETVNTCFFSPDGQAIGFITPDRVLKKVSLADGQVTTLVTDAESTPGGGSWGADDRIVFVRGGALWDIAGNGVGAARPLTSLDKSIGERAHTWPTVVAGGKAVLFTTVTDGPRTTMRIDALVRATGERRVIVESGNYPMYASSGHLVFFRDNALLAASFDLDNLKLTGPPTVVAENIVLDQVGAPMAVLSSAGTLAYVNAGAATRRLVWVSRQGLESPIIDTPRPYQNPRLHPDGSRIIVEIAGGHLWLQTVERSTFERLTTAETIGNTFATWIPHSERVVFRTLAGMRLIDSSGGRPEPVGGSSSGSDLPTSVSPDGRTLAFIRQAGEAGADLYTMSLDGTSEPRPFVVTPGYDGGGQFSPDGRWMAYVSNDEASQFEVYVRPYPGPGRRIPVSTQGGTHPKWNPSGKELFYRTGNKMMVVDVSRSGNDIVFSQPRVLFEQRYAFGGAQSIANYDVSPDGQRFVMVKDDSASGRWNVVLNWTEELKIRVPLN